MPDDRAGIPPADPWISYNPFDALHQKVTPGVTPAPSADAAGNDRAFPRVGGPALVETDSGT